MTKYIDITLDIRPDMPTWPGDPAVRLERAAKIEEGANSNVSEVQFSVHTGTHLDAPVHFIPGAGGVEELSLDVLIGPAVVVELDSEVDVIDRAAIEEIGLPEGTERVLFKTRNSRYWLEAVPGFQTDFVGIDRSGAEYLVELGLRLVGIDYLSVAPYKQSRPTHLALLSAGIIAVEGLDLSRVQPGLYQLICLPLKLKGLDGSPVRAVLVESDDM